MSRKGRESLYFARHLSKVSVLKKNEAFFINIITIDSVRLISIKIGGWFSLFFFLYIKLFWSKPYWNFDEYSEINFTGSGINVIVFRLGNGQFYIRNFIMNKNIQVIFIKSSSVLSTLFHLIDLDLHCWIIRVFGHLKQSI